jgi:predicted cupin superfamily sugar epimerase
MNAEARALPLHRVRADEVWHHYGGGPLDLHTLDLRTGQRVARLGRSLREGERPQHVVPAGVWQAAVPIGEGYSLCGCTVAPGFDFAHFEMPSRSERLRLFPAERELVERLGRA